MDGAAVREVVCVISTSESESESLRSEITAVEGRGWAGFNVSGLLRREGEERVTCSFATLATGGEDWRLLVGSVAISVSGSWGSVSGWAKLLASGSSVSESWDSISGSQELKW